ncbi:MAG TPA: TadE/TadG family type IV pilus assembly protein [Stellaceae bacterium]|nr:TadE/TadG family type IV pilus assembly protein [Stellaceae bacterium]
MISARRMVQRAVGVLRPLLGRARAERSGATAVEFALLLPALAYLIFGVVDMGLMMFASEEMDLAASEAVREIRTGAVQAALAQANSNSSGQSLYAGDSNCIGATTTVANFATSNATTNCLGFTVNSTDTASTVFGELLCHTVPVGGTTGAFLNCNNFNWDVQTYGCWPNQTCSNPAPTDLRTVALTYNSSGNPQTFLTSPGSAAIIVAVIGYKYPFFTPLIGCFFDGPDCGVPGKQTTAPLRYYAVVQAEPF